MRVTTKYTFDIASLRPIEHVYFDNYAGPCELACGGPSQQELAAQNQASSESQMLQADFLKQFSEQQGFLNSFLIPNLKALYENPTGFGPAAIADLEANLVNTTGAQALNAKQAAQESFATNNMKGLPSGVEQAIQAQIGSAAGNTVAQGNLNIGLANQQYKNQQQMTALAGLEGVPGLLGASPQVGGLLTGANQNSFNQAHTINQEGQFGSNLLSGVLGGLINAGVGVATGGLSTLAQGAGSIGSTLFGLGGGGQGANGIPLQTSSIPSVIQ